MTAPVVPSPMLTTTQIAQRLRVKVDTVRAWIKSGELKGVNVGQGSVKPRFRVDPADLALFEQRRSVVPPPKLTRRRRKRNPETTQYF